MNVYILRFPGIWLTGEALVVDTSPEKAVDNFLKEHGGMYPKLNRDKVSVTEVDTKNKQVILIDSGDY